METTMEIRGDTFEFNAAMSELHSSKIGLKLLNRFFECFEGLPELFRIERGFTVGTAAICLFVPSDFLRNFLAASRAGYGEQFLIEYVAHHPINAISSSNVQT